MRLQPSRASPIPDLRVLEQTGLLFCERRVLHAGRTIATGEDRIRNSEGVLKVHGPETCVIMSKNDQCIAASSIAVTNASEARL